MSSVSRRALLYGGAAMAALAAAGGGAFALFDDDDLVKSALRRSVGDFEMEPTEFQAFKTAFFQARHMTQRQEIMFRGAEMMGLMDTLADHATARVAYRFQRFQRMLVTHFLTRTTFLQKDRGAEPVLYLGPQPCLNPFANFDFD